MLLLEGEKTCSDEKPLGAFCAEIVSYAQKDVGDSYLTNQSNLAQAKPVLEQHRTHKIAQQIGHILVG